MDLLDRTTIQEAAADLAEEIKTRSATGAAGAVRSLRMVTTSDTARSSGRSQAQVATPPNTNAARTTPTIALHGVPRRAMLRVWEG